MKSYKTIKEDVYHVLRTGEGYTEEIAEWVAQDIAQSLLRQLVRSDDDKPRLRLSQIGTPCERKLWYSINRPTSSEPLPASAKNKFIFGDLTESHVLGLCMAAGHIVGGMQDTVDVVGVSGSRDCIIDGMLFDVKSASTRGLEKFKGNGLLRDDPFGYLSQLSSYLYGSRNDPLLEYKTKAGFIAVDKQFGHIEVDVYDLTEFLDKKEEEVNGKKKVVKSKTPPPRAFGPEPHGKSGNMKLCTQCSYCDHKRECWPNLRTFLYSNGPIYFTEVAKEPEVMEIK